MVVCLKDGTREYMNSPADWERLIGEKLGSECEEYVRGLHEEIESLQEELEGMDY